MNERIRRIIADQGGLTVDVEALGDGDDLFAAGLTSHATVAVLLALEEELGVELPEELLRKSTFRSVSAVASAFGSLGTAVAG